MRNYQAVARVPLSGWLDRWLLDFIFKRWGSFLAKRSNFGFFGFVVHGLKWRRVTAAKEGLSFTFVAGNQRQWSLYDIEHPSVCFR